MTIIESVAGAAWGQRAAQAAAVVEREALATEAGGTLAPTAVAALHEHGLFGILVPGELGGGGADLLTALAVIEEISRADTSSGWAYMVGATMNGLAGALLPDDGAKEVFSPRENPVLAGMLAPRGRAVVDGDGYRAAGSFSFGSGAQHATWIAAGVAVKDDAGRPVARADGTPEHLALVVAADRVTLKGNWDVLALKGTGSVDYELPEQHVGREFAFSMAAPQQQRGQGLYCMGVKGVAASGHTAVALGIGKRALQEIVEIAHAKARPNQPPVAEQQLFRHDFALHEGALRAARAYAWEVYGDAQATGDAGGVLSDEQEARLRQACTHTHRVVADAVGFAYRWAGTTAMRVPNALGRCLRDLNGATQHVYVDPNSLVEAAPALMRRSAA